MQTLNLPSSSLFGTSNFGSDSRSLMIQQAQAVSIEANWQQEIVLHTHEGDTVTLTASAQTRAALVSYDAMGLTRKTSLGCNARTTSETTFTASGQAFTFLDSREMAVTVAGDLSAAEIADIREAVRRIDAIMTPLLAGKDPSAAVHEAEKLLGLDTLSGIEAAYSVSETVAMAQSAQVEQSIYSYRGRVEADILSQGRLAADPIRRLSETLKEILEGARVDRGKLKSPLMQLFGNMKRMIRDGCGTRTN